MVDVNLVWQKVTELNLQIDFNPETQKSLDIGVNSPFSIQYSDDCKHCIATLEQKISSKENPEQFSIFVKIQGFFDCDEITSDEIKKETHVACYYRLFPYAQSIIANMCVMAGLPPLMIKPMKMSIDDVILNDDK